ncbi:MAG: HU family DNA-binding protein [Deltaproteobacteria bacterium]|nr:HU family DNA-binding protein [Deltaproteobacteria bacterium]MCB9789309.1 HU family DNA-binding protein [Deltaproteobacteria bacterium]
MTKKELADKLAKKSDISKAKALELVNAIFDSRSGHGIIATALDAGEKVQLAGFGTFATKSRSARKGRNPATGAEITIGARTYPVFRPAKGLKERVVR